LDIIQVCLQSSKISHIRIFLTKISSFLSGEIPREIPNNKG
jgi:hypothetical protein